MCALRHVSDVLPLLWSRLTKGSVLVALLSFLALWAKKHSAIVQNACLHLAGCCKVWLLDAKYLEFPGKEFTTVIWNMNAATSSAEHILGNGLKSLFCFLKTCFSFDASHTLFVILTAGKWWEKVFFSEIVSCKSFKSSNLIYCALFARLSAWVFLWLLWIPYICVESWHPDMQPGYFTLSWLYKLFSACTWSTTAASKATCVSGVCPALLLKAPIPAAKRNASHASSTVCQSGALI